MACSVYASPIAAHQSSVVVRPPRRAGIRPASPYARASSLPRTRLRPLSLSLSLNIPLCAMASVSAPELCSSSGDLNPRVRRHGYSASAPSSINSPSKEFSDCPTSTSTSTYSTLASSDYSTSSPDCASAASSSKFPACVSSYSAYAGPASAVTPPANHSPYPISTSNLGSSSLASSSAASSSPSSPVSASSSVYYSCPASAVTSPVSANFTTSPFTPFSPWSTSASSHSRWPTSPYVPPPLSSLSTNLPSHFQSPPSTRSPSPSPIVFSGPPFPHGPSPLDARTPPSFSHITPHIAIADLAFAESPDLLEREGVTHVVSVLRERSHIPACIPPSNRLHVPLDDAPFAELVGHLSPIVQWVKDALEAAGVIGAGNDADAQHNKPEPQPPIRILIHCAHGISRSPAVGAALLVALPLIDGGEVDLSEPPREDGVDGPGMQNADDNDAMEVSSPTTSWTSPVRQCTSPAAFSFLPSPPSPTREATPRPSPAPSPAPTIRLRSPSRLARATLPLFIPPSASSASARSPLRTTAPPPLAVPPPTISSPISTFAAPLPFAAPLSSSLPLPPPSTSTSPSTVKRTLSAPAALAYVSARRPAADVNWGFRAQLREWEGVCRRKSEGAATL
ncbi:hypothetical protein C8R45DRAFT_156389 [Mycena sanguinolenta]|nr:hypothetical protein C8R45DRAFT_156389 [Mycena sanguinolenta]